MANLQGHEAGNARYGQGKPARHRAGPRLDRDRDLALLRKVDLSDADAE
jgi:hypothetical protein